MVTEVVMTEVSRRNLLLVSSALAAGAAVSMLPGVAFAAPESGNGTQTKTVPGPFPPDTPDWFYLPVEVPHGVSQIDVSYTYYKPDGPAGIRGNALDIGMFGPEGV